MAFEVEKVGSRINIKFDEYDKPYSFDIVEKVLYSYTGRKLKTTPPRLKNAFNDGETIRALLLKNKMAFCAVMRYLLYGEIDGLIKIDLYYNFFDLVPPYISIWDLPDELPKGYIPWLRENNRCVSKNSLEDFNREQRIKSWSKDDQYVYNFLREETYYIEQLYVYKTTDEQRKVLTKMFMLSFKKFYLNFVDLCNDFCGYILHESNLDNERCIDDWENYIDTNRDISKNMELLFEASNAPRNKKIVEFETLIKPIENLSTDKLKIIVPTTIEQFSEEGKMQNNCVGSYYHSSIANHCNLIYFIRKADNVDKSYITNRFQVENNYWNSGLKTVESRATNNNDYEDEDARELIKKIDIEIKNILEPIEEFSRYFEYLHR